MLVLESVFFFNTTDNATFYFSRKQRLEEKVCLSTCVMFAVVKKVLGCCCVSPPFLFLPCRQRYVNDFDPVKIFRPSFQAVRGRNKLCLSCKASFYMGWDGTIERWAEHALPFLSSTLWSLWSWRPPPSLSLVWLPPFLAALEKNHYASH